MSGGKQVKTVMATWPSGYSTLPYPGGLLDQPSYVVDAFHAFLRGERAAALKQLSS